MALSVRAVTHTAHTHARTQKCVCMGKTIYGKDASACECVYDEQTKTWIAVVRHKLARGFVRERFYRFDSECDAAAYTAKLVEVFNDPGLSAHGYSKAYKEAMERRSEVLARHEHLDRVSEGTLHVAKNGKYYGALRLNGQLLSTLQHVERAGASTELASLCATLVRGGTLEEHRFLFKAERVRHFHADGTAERVEMESILEKERTRTTEPQKDDLRVSLTDDNHMPVKERFNTNRWFRLCSTPGCMTYRMLGFTKSDKCCACGGGNRCCGPNGKGCPFHMAVTPHENRCDNMCVCCFVEENIGSDDPEIRERLDELNTRHRAKELAVRKVLEEAFPDCKIIFDRAVKDDDDPNSYKTRWAVAQRTLPNLDRPDARFVGGARVILVEVDEHSHVTYVCRDEREREARIVCRALTGKKGAPVEAALLRFNPDAYTDCAGRRVGSCFGRSKGGMLTTLTNEREWKRRARALVETIKTLQIPAGEPGHFALPAPELDARKPLPKPEETPKDARCVWTVELFYDHVVDPTVRAAMCRSRILTLADVRPANESAGGSSSLSKCGANMLAGFKRAAKAKKAKAAKRAKADREDDCPSILEMILRAHCKRGSDCGSDSESEPECGSESDSDESDD